MKKHIALILGIFLVAPLATVRAEVAVDSEPVEITKLQDSIVYPISERRKGNDGRVVLDALIDTNGAIVKVHCLFSTHWDFQEAAVAAMWKMRFTPAVSNGRRIKVWITRTIHFKLNGPPLPPKKFVVGGGIPWLG